MTFDFRGTEMTVLVTTEAYALIEMRHPPSVGPALHVHPLGPETFYILDGTYTFYRGDETITAGPGQAVVVPVGAAHRYESGPTGGRALVVTPPGLERYFQAVAARLAAGEAVSLDDEFALAARQGQHFLDRSGHWGNR